MIAAPAMIGSSTLESVQRGPRGGSDHERESDGRADQPGETALLVTTDQQCRPGGVAGHRDAQSQSDQQWAPLAYRGPNAMEVQREERP